MIAVAIDGPAGAGKSTIARRAANELGYIYVDTGALYRAVGLYMVEAGIDPADSRSVCHMLGKITVSLEFSDGEQRVMLCGRDVTGNIRSEKVSMAASLVSAIPEVRRFLLFAQRGIAEKSNVIMDGRDIGTVVLPNAQVKIFLTASPEDRARRRYEELLCKGEKVNYEDVLKDLKKRDENDMTREAAPLVQAKDAVKVDTTGNTLDKSVNVLLSVIKERIAKIS